MLNNSDLFERLKNGSSVVVPDTGYAVNLKQHFSNWAVRTIAVWQTPSISPWHEWLKHLWLQQQWTTRDCRIVLNDMQQRLLWQRVIESDISTHTDTVLWNLNASISQARSAWCLINDYCLDLSDYPHIVNDVGVFKQWLGTYKKLLDENDWLDPQQLAMLLIDARLQIPQETVEFFGFVKFTPLQSRFFETVFNQQIANPNFIEVYDKNQTVFEYADSDAELSACANWARKSYESDPDISIGVLIADLKHNASKVDSVFKSIFVPDYALDVNQTDVFVSTQKNKLIDKGLINSALNILGLLTYRFDYELFSRFLRDGYIDRDRQLKYELCLLDVKLRNIVTEDISLNEIIVLLNQIQLQGEINFASLISQLQALNATLKTFDKSASIVSWCDYFAGVLKLLGWPDFSLLNSADKQLFKQWDQLYASVCTAGLVYRQLTISEALSLFKNAASFTASKNKHARITIVDIDESDGIYFDVAWICGLSDTVLPRPVKFNPLLPFQLQRDQGLPYSSSEDCKMRADAQFRQLSGLARELRFSYHKNDDYLCYRVSSLLIEHTIVTVEPFKTPIPEIPGDAELEVYTDDTGFPLEDKNAIGGSYSLKSQAQCPFKAYAEKRLAVEPIDKRDHGLDSAERGTLVHRVLHNLWKSLKTRSRLIDLTADELEDLIHEEVAKVVGSMNRSQKLFVDVETKRLKRLSLNWLNLEMSRSHDFRIYALELPLKFSCCGLEFNLQADRVDQLEDGSLLVIDYKTGNASKSSWLDQRVQDPQMPIYYFALGNNVGAISFANTKTLSFDGLSESDLGIKGISQVENNNRGKLKNFENWLQLRQHWNQTIEMLVNEFKNGFASVTPESLGNCKYCGRQSLCRINQHQSVLRADDD